MNATIKSKHLSICFFSSSFEIRLDYKLRRNQHYSNGIKPSNEIDNNDPNETSAQNLLLTSLNNRFGIRSIEMDSIHYTI